MSAVMAIPQEVRNQAQDLVYESCLLLNAQKWNEFLALCEPSVFRYVVGNHSPEIAKDQYWLDLDYGGMEHLFDMLPKHNTDHAQLTRQPTVYKIALAPDGAEATVTSGFSIYRTHEDAGYAHVDGGSTSLYLVGRYVDKIGLATEQPKLLERLVWLDTRQVDIGSHYPF